MKNFSVRPSQLLTRFLCLAGYALLLVIAPHPVLGAVLYQTGFEFSEGYNTNRDLVGQNGWIGESAGGNGLVNGWFSGKGQQAYVGFSPPTNGDANIFVYRPLTNQPAQVQFSVLMDIEDSTNRNWDDFYWSTYNQQGEELFTLDFNNYDFKLYYHLGGDTNLVWSGLTFSNGLTYRLTMNLDFTANKWSATFGGALAVTNKPISSAGASLNLGDFDAAWIIFDPATPGNNLMVFDDYQVTVASTAAPQAQLAMLGLLNGVPTLRVTSVPDGAFAVEGSPDLTHWSALKTNITSGGSFDFVDSSAAGSTRRFYRARWVP